MMPRRYAALSVLALLILCLGLVALALPTDYAGPLMVQWSQAPFGSPWAGLSAIGASFYLADAVGLGLLALAFLVMWAVAFAWERRRHTRT